MAAQMQEGSVATYYSKANAYPRLRLHKGLPLPAVAGSTLIRGSLGCPNPTEVNDLVSQETPISLVRLTDLPPAQNISRMSSLRRRGWAAKLAVNEMSKQCTTNSKGK